MDWTRFGCEVAGIAYSGKKGLSLVEQTNPDILFSDIRMSNLDGLSMIAALKSQHRDLEITILTGFRDFDYAREAITLGVRRFLLKPSRMDEINEAVQAMTGKLAANDAEVPLAEESGTAGNFIVRNALAYMEEHYREKLQLNDVAERVFVSPWHLSKLINSVQNENFSVVLNRIRIRHAKELMKDPGLRIGDIAEQVGFLDLAHFSRVFKKQTGKSPNEFRKTVYALRQCRRERFSQKGPPGGNCFFHMKTGLFHE